MYKIRFLFLNLQRMGKVIRAFCWHQEFVPKGLYALAPRLYTCIKSLKMCIISDFEEFILKPATYGQREKAFLLSSKFCPQCVVYYCPGLYTCGKYEKTCIKSDFKEIVLKLATNGQSDKGFLLTSTFFPQGVVCPYPGAIYMYKSIKIYTRTRCQVSVYKTTGPLVILAGNEDMHKISDGFEFQPGRTTDYGLSCPWGLKNFP